MERPRSVVRLMRDLKELQENPVPNANAVPLEDDLYTWHVNVAGRNKMFDGVHFHLVFKFTEEYPMAPPKVDLFTTIPHPNIFPNKNGCINHVCLDMLETPDFASAEFKDRAFAGWSSSYTVSSILSQLASFLMEENLQFALHKTTPAQATAAAKGFACKGCKHTGSKPFPFVDVPKKEISKKTRLVNIPQFQFARQLATFNAPKPSTPAVKAAAAPVPSKAQKQEALEVKPKKSQVKPEEEEWTVVRHHKKKGVVYEDPDVAYAKKQAMLEAQMKKEEEDKKKAKELSKKLYLEEKERAFNKLSEAEKKIALKKKKKAELRAHYRAKAAEKKKLGLDSPPVVPGTPSQPSQEKKPSSAPQKSEPQTDEDGFEEVKTSKKEEKALDTVSAYATKQKRQETLGKFIVDPKGSYSKGTLDKLPFQMLIEIFSFLPLKDISSLSTTCKGLYQVTQDGLLWKGLFSRFYPHSQLSPQNMNDWKSLFVLEVDHILDELVCFHTKQTFEEDVLGFPIVFTVNPKTNEIDYIDSSMDLLSREAFYVDKIRKTVWKEKFTHWLPIYIDEDHFERGLPFLQKSLTQMTNKPFVQAVLDFFPKFMNTLVVLLMDKGVHASQKTLDGYFAIHRLFIELVQRFPAIQQSVEKSVRDFVKVPESRVKSALPSLGNFLALLSVTEKFNWGSLSTAYLEETFDRNALWIGKAHPTLIMGNHQKGQGADMERLNKSWEASLVSSRLNMFHVHFLLLNRGKSLDQIAAQYDLFFGRPTHKMRSHFQSSVQKILAVNSWPQFFQTIGIKPPTPAVLTDWLKDAINGSKRKGYHSNKTNFSAIQASGVSSILKKGESYKASAHLKTVKMHETWTFPVHSIFLDASCLAYDFSDKYIAVCDFARTTMLAGSVTHSGDVMDYEKKSGTHTIIVKLDQLPKEVKTLWFTMTAYTTLLTDIKQPFVRFTEDPADVELCRYDLEKGNTGNNTCVIMCKLERTSVGSAWSVVAVGHLGLGRASDYEPIKANIDALNKKK